MNPDISPLDPAPTPTTPTADDAALLSVLATDQNADVPADVLPPKRRPRTAWLVGAGVATVCLVGVLVVTLTAPVAVPPAFADWTPAPSPNVSATQQQQAGASCEAMMSKYAPTDDAPVGPPSVVIYDERGSYNATVLVWPGTTFAMCSNLSTDGTGTLLVGPDTYTAAPKDGISFAMATLDTAVFGNPEKRAFTMVSGVADSSVTKVQAVTNLGETVDASLKDGVWVLYSPVDSANLDEKTAGLTQFIVTHADGSTTSMSDFNTGLAALTCSQDSPASVCATPSN